MGPAPASRALHHRVVTRWGRGGGPSIDPNTPLEEQQSVPGCGHGAERPWVHTQTPLQGQSRPLMTVYNAWQAGNETGVPGALCSRRGTCCCRGRPATRGKQQGSRTRAAGSTPSSSQEGTPHQGHLQSNPRPPQGMGCTRFLQCHDGIEDKKGGTGSRRCTGLSGHCAAVTSCGAEKHTFFPVVMLSTLCSKTSRGW